MFVLMERDFSEQVAGAQSGETLLPKSHPRELCSEKVLPHSPMFSSQMGGRVANWGEGDWSRDLAVELEPKWLREIPA